MYRMKRSSVILLGILIFAVVATPLMLTSSADAAHSKAGQFLIPPGIIPPINSAKHVTVPVHHILIHPATQVPVIGSAPIKSQVDINWSCGNDDSGKMGNSENKCHKDLKDKSNNGNSQGDLNNDTDKAQKSQGAFRDDFSNDTNPQDNFNDSSNDPTPQDNSNDVNATEVSANDVDATVNFASK